MLTIARAFLADPKILILDEATSSVDTRTEVLIQKGMQKLMENRTSFVIAHRLSTIRDADLILVMKDGDIIDLGGGYEVEVFDLGGHTPGSVVYLDKKRKIALTGDALGVWMQVPGATDLSTYQTQLVHFLKRMSAPEYEGVVMMNGHRKQEGCYFPYGDQYVPNDLQKVRDMITLVDRLLNGDVAYTPFGMRAFDEPAFTASYGQATIVFTESRLK